MDTQPYSTFWNICNWVVYTRCIWMWGITLVIYRVRCLVNCPTQPTCIADCDLSICQLYFITNPQWKYERNAAGQLASKMTQKHIKWGHVIRLCGIKVIYTELSQWSHPKRFARLACKKSQRQTYLWMQIIIFYRYILLLDASLSKDHGVIHRRLKCYKWRS